MPLAHRQKVPQILCLAQSSRNLSPMLREVKTSGFEVTMAFTADQGVAVCVANQVAAVLLDAAFIRNDDWTVARSLKMVKLGVPILLLDCRARSRGKGLPPGIDAVASPGDPKKVLAELRRCLAAIGALKRR